MDVSVILTYRCNSRCSMCNIWKHPTLPSEEVPLETLAKIPAGVDYLNLTGGEPTLRNDLIEIVDLLYPKAMQLEISSNGLHPEKIEPIIKKYPDVKIRFSLEGFEETNNKIRGEENGFNTKVNGLLKLKELGGTDLGFAITIQDENIDELVELFQFSEKNGFELATSTLHNGFQFHKGDNIPYDRLRIAKGIEELISAQLRSPSIKSWFRGYLNLGLIEKVLGHKRLLRCTAGTDFVFIDPWSDLYACNVRPDLKFGNLEKSSWNEVMHSNTSNEILDKVYHCQQNCWMVGSAKTAMRYRRLPKIPRFEVFQWVLINKMRSLMNKSIPFHRYVDYGQIHKDSKIIKRQSFLNLSAKRKVQTRNEIHYQENYNNK